MLNVSDLSPMPPELAFIFGVLAGSTASCVGIALVALMYL